MNSISAVLLGIYAMLLVLILGGLMYPSSRLEQRVNQKICKLFGHKIGGGYYKKPGHEYFRIDVDCVDGIDRIHANLTTCCQRCNTVYQVGKTHLPVLEDYLAESLKKSVRDERYNQQFCH